MKTLLLAGLSGVTVLATVTPAQAHSNWHYTGGCEYVTASDGTDSPQTQWDGEIDVRAVAMDAVTGDPDPTASITVECELRINGATPGTVVYSAAGTGVAASAGRFSFNADPDDTVTMCDLVTVNGEFHKDCDVPTPIPIVPQPVHDLLDEHVWPLVDPELCAVAQEVGDVVPFATPPRVDVRSDGDVYVGPARAFECKPGPGGLTPLIPPISGRITIADDGSGPVWSATGELANPTHWDCYFTVDAVVCEWLGGFFPPRCVRASAIAVSLPGIPTTPTPWGTADTWAICSGDVVSEFVSSGPSTQIDPVRYQEREMIPQYVTTLNCMARGGDAASAPRPRYVAECGFRF